MKNIPAIFLCKNEFLHERFLVWLVVCGRRCWWSQ